MKICSKCGQPKSDGSDGGECAFYTYKRTGKLFAHCKACHQADNTARGKVNNAATVRKDTWRKANRERANASALAYYHENSEQLAKDAKRRKYNVDFDALWAAQKGLCAACGVAMFPKGRELLSAVVDHDHACCPDSKSCGGCVRGLVHWRCNMVLGYVNDNPQILRCITEYIERQKGSSTS